ncbi:MAG: DUF1116 domain-containing protein [Chloroflexota bacterium]
MYDTINEANQAITGIVSTGHPVLVDVQRAREVIDVLAGDKKVLLHAGPPITFAEMTPPMQGSCVGAVLFEKWAPTEDEARELLAHDVTLTPCHHHGAVGPMGGITSPNMAVIVVENGIGGNRAYCTMNEGIGKVLRFGAYDAEVIARLEWMRDILGPSLAKALKLTNGGLALTPMIARAITMGDEFHQRNIAASALFAKEMAPLLMRTDVERSAVADVQRFLADTDQFFLNLAMAACKSVMDAARAIEEGSVVTAMTRNGKDFGIRVSGLGDEWFTAPVNTPQGLFFTGYGQDQACPDMGDSSITETFGIGGMSMIAAPGVTRFVGAGGFADALAVSEEMLEIVVGNNPNLPIPTWDFQGAPLGIDIRKVVETSITPIINTGIASLEPGVGQIGAGTVRAPLACFVKALEALAAKYDVVATGT